MRQRIAVDGAQSTPRRVGGLPAGGRWGRLLAPAAALVAAAALAGSLILTPAGSLAQSFITIFEPTSFTPVSLSSTDLQDLSNLPNLRAFGAMHRPTAQLERVSDRAAAVAATGLMVRTPASLPSGVPATITYMVLKQSTASFTFSAARASTTNGHAALLPPMPRKLDGSTLAVTVGPAVVSMYGGNLHQLAGQSSSARSLRQPAGQSSSTRSMAGALPALVVAQATVPQVGSTGASVQTIESYLLKLPGITPHLAQQIRAIGDPNATLPIPIPLDFANAQTVQVQGVQGLAVGDNTGLGSGVIWRKAGEVYGVAGTLPERQILAIANSLR
jgi:hypothetical protein